MATKPAHPNVRVEPWAVPRTFSAGSSGILAAAGAAGILLGALGLARVTGVPWDALAVLILGGAITLRGALALLESKGVRDGATSGGFSSELCLGLSGALLGLFALAGGAPGTLTAVAVILLGAGLILGSAASARLVRGSAAPDASAGKAVRGAAGLDSALGAGAVVLGILALGGASPRPLTLVSEIAIGLALVAIGAVLARRAPGARNG